MIRCDYKSIKRYLPKINDLRGRLLHKRVIVDYDVSTGSCIGIRVTDDFQIATGCSVDATRIVVMWVDGYIDRHSCVRLICESIDGVFWK